MHSKVHDQSVPSDFTLHTLALLFWKQSGNYSSDFLFFVFTDKLIPKQVKGRSSIIQQNKVFACYDRFPYSQNTMLSTREP